MSGRSSTSAILIAALFAPVWGAVPVDPDLRPCGAAYYHPAQYTCYEGDFLCPMINGKATLRCGEDCYLPDRYSCSNNHLVYPPQSNLSATPSTSVPSAPTGLSCSQRPVTQHLSDPPYENFFISDCHSSSQVVVTSPLSDSNLTVIGPRLIVSDGPRSQREQSLIGSRSLGLLVTLESPATSLRRMASMDR